MLIRPGNRVKVEVFLKDPPFAFHTTVRSCNDTFIEVAAPTVDGKKVSVPPGTEVALTETAPDGLTVIQTKVAEVRPKPHVTWLIEVPPLEKIHKIQRRREPRYEVDLHFPWRNVGGSEMGQISLCHVININSHGALISTGQEFNKNDEIILDLTPLIQISGESFEKKVTARAKVVRRHGDSGTVYGVSFEHLGRREKAALLSAIRRLKSKQV